jgi:hypothetical protein
LGVKIRYDLYKNKFNDNPVEKLRHWGDSGLFPIGLNSGRIEISGYMTV